MQTAHAQSSQPGGGAGQKHSTGLLNNIWSQGEGSGWPVTSSAASTGWSQPSHIQSGGPGDSASNDLGWGGSGGQLTPSVGGTSPWGPSTTRSVSGGDSLVVDTHDKEAWPSIGNIMPGDHMSETGSNVDDVETASAKSGSVISSSSNPGMGSGLGDSLSTSSGLPAQKASSMGWGGSSSAFSSSDKLDSNAGNSWGIGPDTASSLGVGGGMWGASTPSTSQASSLGALPGWGSSNGSSNGAEVNGAGNGWQGMNFSGNSMDLQQNVAASSADSSGWGAPSTNSTSVIASSISSSLDNYKGASSIGSSLLQNSADNSGAASGWGSAEPPPKPDSQVSGWGSPCPTPALTNTGTDAWVQKQTPNMSSWGQTPTQQASNTTGWGQPDPPKPTSSGWGESPKPAATPGSGWGQPMEPKPNSGAGAWGQPSPEVNKTDTSSVAGWGAPPKPGNQQDSGTSGWGAPTSSQPQPTSASSWGGTQQTAPGNVQQKLPRPIGAAQPPPAQPSSWADAASRGLPPKTHDRSNSRDAVIRSAVDSNDGWGKTPVRQDTSWDMEESPKLPRKPLSSSSSNSSQDNANWNQPNDGTAIWESSKGGAQGPPQQAPQTGNQWGSQPNNVPPIASQQLAPASSTHWGNPDADGGTWEGPPDAQRQNSNQNTNMWNGPPGANPMGPPSQPSNHWGGDDKSGHWGSSGSSGSDWGSGKSDNGHGPPPNSGQWGAKRDDNVWDRDGTHSWGSGGPPQRSNSATDFGTWGSGGGDNRPQAPAATWGGETSTSQQNWGRNGPPPGSVDTGTAYWGDPGKGSWNSQARGPPGPPDNRPSWAQPPKPGGWDASGQPKSDAPMWGQQEPPKPSASWGEPAVSGWSAMKRQPSAPAGWGDTNDWNKGPVNDMSRPPPQPQMRSRMLMQLTNMGFKKDDAQRALINNNMNLESAIRDLVHQATGHGADLDGEQKGRALRSMHSSREDLSGNDPHASASAEALNPLVPPPMAGNSMVAAQLAAHNNAALANHLKQQQQPGTSLNPTSSLTAPSINPLLQKQLPQVGKQPSPQGQPIRGSLQHQILHSQLSQQLQMAVQTGLISPKLLNSNPTPHMIIMMNQLLQLATLLQRLVHQQQLVQQNRQITPQQQRTQQEQLAVMINKIKQQILNQQQQIQAQQVLAKQQVGPPTPVIPSTGQVQQAPPTSISTSLQSSHDLPATIGDLSNLSLANSSAAPTATSSAQPQSRLNQWIKDSNQANFKQSHSTPNLQSKDDTTSGLGLSDSTWSPSVSGSSNVSWPANTSGTNTMTTSTSSANDSTSGEATDQTKGSSGDSTQEAEAALDIVEFVPGKQWQGLKYSFEDDPFITPAAASRSIGRSMSQINEDRLSILSGSAGAGSKSSASSPGDPSGDGWGASKQWSTGDDSAMDNKAGNPVMGQGAFGVGAATSSSATTIVGRNLNRSMSMPAGPAAAAANAQRWGAHNSNWLILKNLSSRIDSNTLETLCKQHGLLQTFLMSAQHCLALVCYKTQNSAVRAQTTLHNCNLGGTTIMAEFINENDALTTMKILGPANAATSMPSGSMGSSLANLWSAPSQMGAGSLGSGGSLPGNASANAMWSTGGDALWGNPGGLDDPPLLPNNLL